MQRRFAVLAGLISGVVAVGALTSPARAGEMRPEEAKRFIAGKLFSYTCFDGSSGAGRIHADGSVVGTMQADGGRTKFFALPAGTIKLTADTICASLPRAILQPCFNVTQTSSHSFRGSLRGLGFAYCDFERRNPRVDIVRREADAAPVSAPASTPVQSAVALRPSRY
jgi:hypothetical protein